MSSLNDNGLIKWFYEHGLDQAAHHSHIPSMRFLLLSLSFSFENRYLCLVCSNYWLLLLNVKLYPLHCTLVPVCYLSFFLLLIYCRKTFRGNDANFSHLILNMKKVNFSFKVEFARIETPNNKWPNRNFYNPHWFKERHHHFYWISAVGRRWMDLCTENERTIESNECTNGRNKLHCTC